MTLNHTEVCHVAAKWVRKKHRCSVVLVDVKTINTSEQPDVLGWTNGGWSVLVEAKVSVMDFIRDAKKPFRRRPERGMGCERWYAMPAGLWEKIPMAERIALTEPNALGSHWGLVEFDAKGKAKVILKAEPFREYARAEEKRLLITSVRRVTEGWGRGIIADTPGELLANGDRHPINRIRQLEADLQRVTRERDAMRKTLDRIQTAHALTPTPADQGL